MSAVPGQDGTFMYSLICKKCGNKISGCVHGDDGTKRIGDVGKDIQKAR